MLFLTDVSESRGQFEGNTGSSLLNLTRRTSSVTSWTIATPVVQVHTNNEPILCM